MLISQGWPESRCNTAGPGYPSTSMPRLIASPSNYTNFTYSMTKENPPSKELTTQSKRWRPRVRTGCLTCRQRKIKCDEARPFCQRCLATSRPCKGYVLTKPAITAPPPTPFTGSKALYDVMLYFPWMDECVGASTRDPQKELRGKVEVLLHHLPRRVGHSVALDTAVKCVAAGMRDVLTHYKAMGSVVRFAGFYNGKTLDLYTRALKALRLALDDPVLVMEGETLFAALLICCFESFRMGNMDTVKKHLIGIAKMVQHRGPGRYEGEFERELLFHHRPVIAIACYVAGMPCFLYDEDWQKINLEVNAVSERHQFTSSAEYYLEEVTTLVADCWSFIRTPHTGCHETLLQKLQSYNERVNEWRDDWVRKFAGPDSNALSVVETFGKKHNMGWLAISMASYYVFFLLSHRLRVALGCDGAMDVEKEIQSTAKSVRSLYEKHRDLPEPFLLPHMTKAAVDTKDEWTRFSVKASAVDGLVASVYTFARWLKLTGVNVQLET